MLFSPRCCGSVIRQHEWFPQLRKSALRLRGGACLVHQKGEEPTWLSLVSDVYRDIWHARVRIIQEAKMLGRSVIMGGTKHIHTSSHSFRIYMCIVVLFSLSHPESS